MTPCEHCGRDTPDEPFCTWCGANRMDGAANPNRLHHYAAHPHEHVAQPSVLTTLFPHLPGRRMHEFRWTLIGGVAVVVALVGAGLVVAAILTAAILVPVLYLVYLYEAQVYRDEPVQVVGLTMGAGLVLGVIVTVIADAVESNPSRLLIHGGGGLLLGSTVLLPIIQELIKPLPTLPLRRLPQFKQTIDGLVFGVAAGLGFAVAETIVNFSKVISTEPVRTSAAQWIFPVIGLTVLTPLLQGSCTGAFTASIWRGAPWKQAPIYMAGIPLAIGAHVVFSLVTQALADNGVNQGIILVFQAFVVLGVLIYIRFLVHRALLDEAEEFGLAEVTCPSCRRHIAAAAFCPHCGGAVSAGPRRVATPASPPARQPATTGGADA